MVMGKPLEALWVLGKAGGTQWTLVLSARPSDWRVAHLVLPTSGRCSGALVTVWVSPSQSPAASVPWVGASPALQVVCWVLHIQIVLEP